MDEKTKTAIREWMVRIEETIRKLQEAQMICIDKINEIIEKLNGQEE